MVIALIGLVISLGAPSIIDAQRTMTHKGAVESSYFAMQAARARAISSGNNVTVSFEATTPWCIGISDVGPCNCQVANSCLVDGVERVVAAADFENIVLQEINFGGNGFTVYDGQRGMALNNAGSFVLSDGSTEARIELNTVGRLRVCTEVGDLGTYPQC